MSNPQELSAMRRAIAISAQGLGSTSPNPPVGCVILDREGRTISEGYHVRKGEAHAEVHALAAAGKLAAGGTAVVTLEPCNHHGRTPPCREALINADVSRVLIAVMDPTSRGEGGAGLLRKSGVEVEQDFLRDEALLVLGPWLESLSRERPFVTWVFEAAPDGTPVSHDWHDTVCNEARTLYASHDIVIQQSGAAQEGRPGHHGSEVFEVPHGSVSGDPADFLSALRYSGVRSVLLVGMTERAMSLATSESVDQVIAYLPHTPRSWAPASGRMTSIPDNFRLTNVTRIGNYVRVAGRRH